MNLLIVIQTFRITFILRALSRDNTVHLSVNYARTLNVVMISYALGNN
jgi:hypothetical protein